MLRGNIRVMCRVRPAGKGPKSPTAPTNTAGSASCISVPLDGLVCVNDASTARQWEFEFDAAFGPESSQEQVGLAAALTVDLSALGTCQVPDQRDAAHGTSMAPIPTSSLSKASGYV